MPSSSRRLRMKSVSWAVSRGVHAGRRLVEQEQARLVGERAGDLEPALVAVRQVAREHVAACRAGRRSRSRRHGLVLCPLLVLLDRASVPSTAPIQVEWRWWCWPTRMFSIAVMFANSRMFW